MKKILISVFVAISMLLGFTSCETMKDGWLRIPGVHAPINFGVKYQLEDNLYLIVVTGDKGGFEVKLDGVGEYVKTIDGGYEITSSKSGLTYHVTTDENNKVSVYIVSGNGKIQPYTPEVVE